MTPKGALPGTFTITFTTPGGAYLAMTIDEFNYATRATYSIDSSGTNTQAAATSISLASALSVYRHGSDLRSGSAQRDRNSVSRIRIHLGLQWPSQSSAANSCGIASEYLLSEDEQHQSQHIVSVVGLAALTA